MTRALLFDLDYTLLRTGGLGRITVDGAFRDTFGVDDAWGDTNSAGLTDPRVFQDISLRLLHRRLNDSELDRVFASYIAHFRAALESAPCFQVLPGVSTLLNHLKHKSELFLGVQTGNIQEVAKLKLRKAGLENNFSFGAFGDYAYNKSKVVEKAVQRLKTISSDSGRIFHQIYVVGDSPADIVAGREHSCLTIGVCTGHASRKQLLEAGANHVLEDLSDTNAFLSLLNL